MSCRPGTTSRASAPAISPMTMMLTMRPSMMCPSVDVRPADAHRSAGRLMGRGVPHLHSTTPRAGATTPLGGLVFDVMAPPTPLSSAPITVALVDDYDVVCSGVAQILDQYRDRVVDRRDRHQRAGRRRRRHRAVRLLRPTGVRPRRDQGPDREPARAPRRGLHLELPPRPGRERPPSRACTATCRNAARPRPGRRAGGGARRRDRGQRPAAPGPAAPAGWTGRAAARA